MHRRSIFITDQGDATQSSLFIILQVHSTRFGCQPHPSSGEHKTVTTASSTGHIFVHLPPTNVAKLGHVGWTIINIYIYIFSNVVKVACPHWKEVAAQKNDQYRKLLLQCCVLLMMGWARWREVAAQKYDQLSTWEGKLYIYIFNVVKLAWPRWKEVAAQKIWLVPKAVVTVLCTPDDGCGWHPKHVDLTCRIINRLLCAACRWAIFYIIFACSCKFYYCAVRLLQFTVF